MKRLINIAIILLVFVSHDFAQTRNFKLVKAPVENLTSQKRKAMVIGMSDYGAGKSLNNTLNDANDMADVLTKLGFEVTLLTNNDLRSLNTNLGNWYNTIEGNDMAVFYYAGHGIEVNGQNFLIPMDAELGSQTDVQYNTLNVNQVLGNMDEKRVGMKLLILDACRDNPFTRGWSRGGNEKGLAGMAAPKGTYIAFAAAPGATAQDGGTYGLRNGVFTHYLKEEILKPGVPIDIIFNRIGGGVAELTHDQQIPFKNSSLTGTFYFIPQEPSGEVKPTPTPIPTPTPVNSFANYTEVIDNLNIAMVAVAGGTFTMGATPEQGGDSGDDENPAHQVNLSDYYIGKYEVTQAQWQAVMGRNPSSFKGDDLPVESVTWNDIQEFIGRLNARTGKLYRLPTEAEWEFAARGGVAFDYCPGGCKYSGSNNLDNVSWYDANSNSKTHSVGSKSSNELGIYDMSGNVYEWCSDWYGDYNSAEQTNPQGPSSGTDRVNRGGSWVYNAKYCRVSFRSNRTPDTGRNNLGFRLACSSK